MSIFFIVPHSIELIVRIELRSYAMIVLFLFIQRTE